MKINTSHELTKLQLTQHRRYSSIALILFLLIITLSFFIILISDYQKFENDFNSDTSEISSKFNYYIKQNEVVLEGFSAFISGLGEINSEVLNRYAMKVESRFPHIYMLEIAEAVEKSNLETFIQSKRQKGLSDFKVKAFDYSGKRDWRKLSNTEVHFPLIYLYPLPEESRKVLGLDMSSHSHLSIPLNRANDTGGYETSSPFNLIEGDKAYVMFKSVDISKEGSKQKFISLLVVTAKKLLLETMVNNDDLGILIHHNSKAPFDPSGYLFHKQISLNDIFPIITFQSAIDDDKIGYILSIKKQFKFSDFRWYLIIIIAMLLSFLFFLAKKILLQNVLMQKNAFDEIQCKSKVKAISHLTGGIAHEFNNNLSVVRGFLSLLSSRENNNKESLLWIRNAEQASEKCIALTKSLLTYSRYKGISERISGVNINDLIIDLKTELSGYLNPIIRLNIDLREIHSLTSMSDVDLKQILIQVIKNSNDAIEGEGEVFITTSQVSLNDSEGIEIGTNIVTGEYVHLAISDTGCGISEDIKLHVFDPFFTTKDIGKGAGMGLSTVFGLVKLNNGYINFDSIEHQGTTFNIYIPIINKTLKKHP